VLREEHRLKVFGNRVLRRMFGPKKDEVTGGWRKLRNEELHKSRRMRRGGKCNTYEEEEGFSGKTRSKETTRMT
jgi:hypothetical protein